MGLFNRSKLPPPEHFVHIPVPRPQEHITYDLWGRPSEDQAEQTDKTVGRHFPSPKTVMHGPHAYCACCEELRRQRMNE